MRACARLLRAWACPSWWHAMQHNRQLRLGRQSPRGRQLGRVLRLGRGQGLGREHRQDEHSLRPWSAHKVQAQGPQQLELMGPRPPLSCRRAWRPAVSCGASWRRWAGEVVHCNDFGGDGAKGLSGVQGWGHSDQADYVEGATPIPLFCFLYVLLVLTKSHGMHPSLCCFALQVFFS